jgi:serine/threonine-protein kinase
MSDEPVMSLVFDGHCLDARRRLLFAPDGNALPLTAKAFDTLLYLVEHADRVVSKEELMAAVWPGRVVEENNLTQAVSGLRRALGTSGGEHRYIVTVPGSGYRFVADLQRLDSAVEKAPGTDDGQVAASAASSLAQPADRGYSISSSNARRAILVALLIMATMLTWVALHRSDRTTGDDVHSSTVAILPFRAVATDARDPLLETGLAETLITRLSASSALRVRSLGSVQRFANAPVDPMDAGRDLQVNRILEGTTQRRDDRVRITVRLLSVPEGRTLWADTFDERYDQVFLLQDRIADAVVSALALRPDQAPAVKRSPCDGVDGDAYRTYLAARDLINAPSPPRLHRAIADFRQVLDLDPTCARAWAGQAFAWRALSMTGDVDPKQAFPIAKAAVQQALALDPASAEAYASQGFIEFWYDWDWPAAEHSLRHAIELNPSLAEAHLAYGNLLLNLRRFEEAVAEMRQARELDPLSPLINTLEASVLSAAGRRDEAQTRIERALELAPDFWIALLTRGGMELGRGEFDAAIADLERARARSEGSQVDALLGQAYAMAGRREQAETLLKSLTAKAADAYVPPTSLAAIENALGRVDRALDLLEQAYAARDVRLAFIHTDTRWQSLRAEPRFVALERKVGQ